MKNTPMIVEINGHSVLLNDPIVRAVEKINCQAVFDANTERIAHFRRRAVELGKSNDEVVIVLLCVDDQNGGQLAEALMPGYDWNQFREKGETPYARGLATRKFIQSALEIIDPDAVNKLKSSEELSVVVVAYGIAEIY